MKNKNYFICDSKAIHTFEHDIAYLVYLTVDTTDYLHKSELTLKVDREEYDTYTVGDAYVFDIKKAK